MRVIVISYRFKCDEGELVCYTVLESRWVVKIGTVGMQTSLLNSKAERFLVSCAGLCSF